MGAELEQKYVVDSPRPWAVQTQLLSRLSRAGYQVTFLEEKPQRDTYFDTPEGDILKGGGSLRLREKGKKNLLCVKAMLRSGEGRFLRREEELVLGREAEPMPFLRDNLPGVDLERLLPTAVVVNRRRTYEVSRTGGGRFELAFDDGRGSWRSCPAPRPIWSGRSPSCAFPSCALPPSPNTSGLYG